LKKKEKIKEKEYEKVHVLIKKDILKKAFAILTNRFGSPTKRLYIIVNEALQEYIEKHKDEAK
jgi:hypothetical protein